MAKNKGNTSYKELQKKLNSTQKDGKNRAASLKDALDKSRNKKSGNKAVNNKIGAFLLIKVLVRNTRTEESISIII